MRRCCFFEGFNDQLGDIEVVGPELSVFYFQKAHGLKFMGYEGLHYRIYG